MKRTKQIFTVMLAFMLCLTFAPKPAFAADRTGELFNTIRVLVEQYYPADGNGAALQAYGAGVCAFLLTVPVTDTIYLDEIMTWLQETLGGDEAMGWTAAACDSWSYGDTAALQAHASGYGQGVTLGMEPVDYGQPASEPEITMSEQEAAERDAAMYGIAPAPEAPMAAPAEAAASERPESAFTASSGGWNGVWVRGGDTFAIIGNGASMYHVDGNGNGLSISTTPEEVTAGEIHSRIYDPNINYEAEYHLTLSGDTLEFTHIYYVDGTRPITTQASGTYTRTGEDANTGYNRLRNKPAAAQPSAPIQPSASVQPAAPVLAGNAGLANPTPSKVIVNGAEQSFEAYNIEGSNYFKLRDIAYVLNGTNKQFGLGYDNTTKAITMMSGIPYTVTGGEMVPGDGQPKPATPTASMIYLNGQPLNFTAYSIAGNNFFKLVDLMSVLSIGVIYNEATGDIIIDTNGNHTGVITVSTPNA